MKPEVAKAIEELKRAFPSSEVIHAEDGSGGAYVIVEDINLGGKFRPSDTWIGGHITALYPYADIYPVFIGENVRRVDRGSFQAPVTPGVRFHNRPAIQISRRNNHTQSFPQTAVAKFLKVLHFLEELK